MVNYPWPRIVHGENNLDDEPYIIEVNFVRVYSGSGTIPPSVVRCRATPGKHKLG